MRTPLDAFHGALLGLVAQRRADELCRHGFPKKDRRCEPCIRARNPRRAAKGYEGERVIFWPAANLPEAQDRHFKKAGTIIEISGGSTVVALDTGHHLVTRLNCLDAEPLMEEDVEDAIESIMRSLRKEE